MRDQREALMGRIRDQLDKEAGGYGIEVIDVRIRRADLPEQNSQAVYQRMQTERQREAAEFRAQGGQKAQEIRSKADREATVIIAEANSQASRRAARATASATASSRKAIRRTRNSSPSIRAMAAYETSLKGGDTASCCGRIRSSSASSPIRRAILPRPARRRSVDATV